MRGARGKSCTESSKTKEIVGHLTIIGSICMVLLLAIGIVHLF